MIRTILGTILLLLTLVPAAPANAASFDCGKATTAFENAICDNPKLSTADEKLATAFATAIGGLSKSATGDMRADQRAWLDFAASSCTDDAQPLSDFDTYNERQLECLNDAFVARLGVLEQSRMLGGYRFAVSSQYGALPDPDAAGDANSYFKVATHQLSYPVLDTGDADAQAFNDFIVKAAEDASGSMSEGGDVMREAQSDSNTGISLDEVLYNRLTLKVSTNWFGHGAAHSNWSVSYVHYLLSRQRALEASDMFTGDDWQDKLTELSLAELKREHGDNLQLDDSTDISGIVTDPARWSFASDYGLTIQFEPYEVSAYAYGAPTIVVPWESLDDIVAEGADGMRFGN
jgi:uncharacterized protein